MAVVVCVHRTLTMAAMVVAAGDAHADDRDGDARAPSPLPAAATRAPDATLRAVKDRVVRLELDGEAPVEGRLLDFEDASVTIARTTTNEVMTIARANLLRVIMLDAPSTVAVTAVPVDAGAQPAVERLRVVGLQMSLLGTVAVDAEYKLLRGFASTSLLLPIATASGSNTWLAGAVGAGVTLPMGKTSRWKLDVFGQVVPFHTTSFYTYLGFGIGAGAHYTAPSGFTLGVTFPVLGFSTRLGSSPYGYDASFRYNDSLAYYYTGAIAGMPLLTLGYRFATNCPKPD